MGKKKLKSTEIPTAADTAADAAAAATAAAPDATSAPAVSPLDIMFDLGENPSGLKRLYGQLYNSAASKKYMADRAASLKVSPEAMAHAQQEFFKSPLNVGSLDIDGVKGSSFGNTARLLGANIKAHPWKTAGTGLGLATNIAGAFDNDNFLGQGLGMVAGAALPKFLGLGLSPYGTLNSVLAGGALGGLFDVLTEAKEKEKERMARRPASETTY